MNDKGIVKDSQTWQYIPLEEAQRREKEPHSHNIRVTAVTSLMKENTNTSLIKGFSKIQESFWPPVSSVLLWRTTWTCERQHGGLVWKVWWTCEEKLDLWRKGIYFWRKASLTCEKTTEGSSRIKDGSEKKKCEFMKENEVRFWGITNGRVAEK